MSSLKKTAGIIAILLVLATLASCAGEGAKTDVTTQAPASSTPVTDLPADTGEVTTEVTFADADYGGETFRIYARQNSTYNADYIDADEENGDIMNDSVFRRNARVEEKYKIVIEMKTAKTPYKSLDKDISGGVVDYDLIIDRRCELAESSVSGLLYDFNSVDIDYTRPWWDDNARGYTIANHLFMMANDVNTGNLSGARFLYFNKQIIDSFNLDDPYELVAKDDWTLESFLTLLKTAHEDRGEGELGVYGLLMETGASNGNHMHLLVGCGVKSTSTADDGTLTQIIGDQKEKIADIFERLSTVLSDPLTAKTYKQTCELFLDGSYKNDYDRGRGAFAAGHFLFVQNGMGVAAQFADMQDKYGLVPNPKYDKDQKNYYHKIDKYSVIWGIANAPDTIDLDRLVNVFDYWAYVSSSTVMPTYYEVTIKTRRFSDPTASEMLDIVKGSLVYDACDIYGIGINSTLDSAYTTGNIGSTLNASYLRTVDSAIKSITTSIKKKYGS